MAKKSIIAREKKRQRTVIKFAERRGKLKDIIKDPNTNVEAKVEAQIKLQCLPRDASPIRLRNRCSETGRPHGFYRKFGLGRSKLREYAMRGEVPGVVKASW